MLAVNFKTFVDACYQFPQFSGCCCSFLVTEFFGWLLLMLGGFYMVAALGVLMLLYCLLMVTGSGEGWTAYINFNSMSTDTC